MFAAGENFIWGQLKTRRTILILEVLAITLVLGIFVWQLSTLPSLEVQLRSGLHNGLETIAEDCATTLDQRFEEAISRSNRLLAKRFTRLKLQVKDVDKWSGVFYPIAAATPMGEGWFIALPNAKQKKFRVFDYKKPSRYRKNTGTIGQFRENTDLSRELKGALESMVDPSSSIQDFATNRWASAVDSNVVFSFDRTFHQELLIGYPVFFRGTDSLKAIVFSQVNEQYFQEVFLRDFFIREFWTGGEERFGIQKRYLQFGVISSNGDRLLYHSVAYGEKNFEHLVQLSDLGSSLSDLTVGVGFRDAKVKDVAYAIYERNYYLIIGLFIFLIILLAMIFFSAIRLLKLSRLKTEFVANVSHEIKTPLSSIRLATDTLRLGRTKTPEQMERLVEILSTETDRLQHLIYTLLDFSQLEAGRKKFHVEEIKAEAYLQEVGAYFQREVGADLEITDRSLIGGQVKVDRKAMEQVFTIFIDNAKKYGKDNPTIQLIAKRRGKWLSIGVKDFGIGIRKEDQSIIFDKFVRLEDINAPDTQGHGIGLSIAKSILTAMGGKVGVTSRAGNGSTFFVELPIV